MTWDMDTSYQSELDELRQAHETADLISAYERCAQEAELVIQDEEARRLRLQILLLEDENDDLHSQLIEEDGRINYLEKGNEELQSQLGDAQSRLQDMQGMLRTKNRDLEALRTELQSLSGVSSNFSELLSEKFTLTHELASLKPELEHLRAMSGTHQSVLSEKLSLQRQLATVQLELESEKRAVKRLSAKSDKTTTTHDNKGKDESEKLRAELAQERKERERIEKESKKVSSEWETKRGLLEGKLEAMRAKLRSTKEALKETQSELAQAQTAAVKAAARTTATSENAAGKNPRKRKVEIQDAGIGTPDGLGGTNSKRIKRASAMPGDKSTFSITPFLNRTASLAPESPPRNVQEAIAEENEQSPIAGSPSKKPATTKSAPAPKKAETMAAETSAAEQSDGGAGKVLGAAKADKTNAKPPRAKKERAMQVLEKVAEEENNENEPPTVGADESEKAAAPAVAMKAAATLKPKAKTMSAFPAFGNEPEPKKKKRKLLGGGLGKTLFDDDEEGTGKPMAIGALGGGKGMPSWIKGGLAGSKGGIKGGLGGTASALGGFSPLKKDRRAATNG